YPDVVSELSYETIRRERSVAVVASSHRLANETATQLEVLPNDLGVVPLELAPRLHAFFVAPCRRPALRPVWTPESTRTPRWIGAWNPSTAVILPASVSNHLPHGTVAVPLARPTDLVENQLVWRTGDQNPVVTMFVALSDQVFDSA